MLTLDEVIERLEGIFGYISDSTKNDVLLYLKLYRSDKAQWEIDREAYETAGRTAREAYEAARDKHLAAIKELNDKHNPPLTWDELRTMEGKPVWIELLGKGQWKGWDVIGGFYTDDFGDAMCTVRLDDYYLNDLEKTWQAYRKERS